MWVFLTVKVKQVEENKHRYERGSSHEGNEDEKNKINNADANE
jgi:hypothetical protein